MSKVFVSYKHRDKLVRQISGAIVPEYGVTTARNYVDILDGLLTQAGHICKAEEPNEDLSGRSEEWIATKLADRIYDSTVTIVLVSKGMNEGRLEKEQWIPWEVSYSLKENTRGGRTSATNAMLAVALPDENGLYDYFVVDHNCPACRAQVWHKEKIFKILAENMFNRLRPRLADCQNEACGMVNMHTGNDHSYIHPVKWHEFIRGLNGYIDLALQLQKQMDDYDLKKELT